MLKLSFPPIADIKSKILLLGTMPGEQSLKHQEYYAHKGNHFWRLMFSLLGEPPTNNYEQKKQILLKNGIAVWDVLQACERVGAADSAITKEIVNDFRSFYEQFPNISSVFFTSKKAGFFYDQYVGRDNLRIYYTLSSPSSANTWKTLDEKLSDWHIIKSALK
jgi:hypoxanthine-DNA glycosylase